MITRTTAALMTAATLLLAAPIGHADDPDDDAGTERAVCGAYNLGVPPDQIAQGLHRNDHRINKWEAQRDANWPTITGDCG